MNAEPTGFKPDFIKRGAKGFASGIVALAISKGVLIPGLSDAAIALVVGVLLAADRWAQNAGYY